MSTTDNPVEPVKDMAERMYGESLIEEPAEVEPTEIEEEAEEEAPEDTDAEVDAEEDPDAEQSETDDTDGDDDAEPAGDDFVEEINGKKVNRKELREGYLRQSDYTRKTTEVAEERKAVAAKQAEVDKVAEILGDIQTEIQTLVMGDVQNVDWDSVRISDPSEYLRLKEVEAARSKKLAGLVEKRNQVVNAKIAEEGKALHEALGWKDAAKKQADIEAINGYLQEQGITETVTSHKLMLAIHKAAMHDRFQRDKVKTLKEVKKAPKVTKPVKQVKKPEPTTLLDRMYPV